MKKNGLGQTKYAGLIFVACVIFACSETGGVNNVPETVALEKSTLTEEDAAKQLIKDIEKTESELASSSGEKAMALRKRVIDFYANYSEIFPNDARTPEMSFKAGNESVNIEDFKSALHFYSLVEQRYTEYQKRAEAIYLQGFIYDTYTKEFGLAEAKYTMLIDLYPNHVLAEQAKMSIANLGMSDEDLIKKFESQNN